jgi:Leucine-rich repeat (LRR) protein
MNNEFVKNNNGIVYLDLTSNPNYREIIKNIVPSEKIQQIYLDSLQIESLDDIINDILKFKETLEYLWLDRNKLKDLPTAFKELYNLKALSLGFNFSLEKYPEVISDLSNLEQLNLNSAKFQNLENSIVNLKKLTRLDLTSNKLLNDISMVYNMESLEILKIPRCPNISISKEIKNLKSLKELFIISDFNSLPDELFSLSSIENLHTIEIKLGDKIEKLSSLTNLKEFNFNGLSVEDQRTFMPKLQSILPIGCKINEY